MQELTKHSGSLGMRIAQPCDVVFQQRGEATGQFLKRLVLKHKRLELIVVILPKKGADSGYGMWHNSGLHLMQMRWFTSVPTLFVHL